jgi:hypothetical protein
VRRNFILLLLACVGTFFSVIFYFRDHGPGNANAEGTAIVDQDVGGGTGIGKQFPMPVQPGPAASAPRPLTVATDNSKLIENSPTPSPDMYELPAEVSGAADPDARAMVLRQLDGAATPESLNVLEQTLRDDDVARNRLLAVNSLRLMAKRGEHSDRILTLLRSAMADADPNVATSARDAYREVAL